MQAAFFGSNQAVALVDCALAAIYFIVRLKPDLIVPAWPTFFRSRHEAFAKNRFDAA